MEFRPKNCSFLQKNKMQPKKQNKPNSSPSGVPNVRGGWVESDVWDKVPKKMFFFTPSLIYCIKGISSIVLVWWKSNAQAASVCPCLDLAPLVVPGSGHLQPSLIKFSRFDFFEMYLVFRGQKLLQHWKPLFSTQLIEVSWKCGKTHEVWDRAGLSDGCH